MFLPYHPLHNTSLLSLHLSCAPSAAGPGSQLAAPRWSIMSLIGGMGKMATVSKGRKQRLEGLGVCGDGENEGGQGKLRDRGEKERDFVLIRGGRVHSSC